MDDKKMDDKKEKIICSHCGGEIVGKYYETHDGNIICEDCFENDFFKCEDCGEIYPERYRLETHDGNLICEYCYEDSYYTCEHCGEIYHINEGYIAPNDNDNAYYCNDCASDILYQCDDCGEFYEHEWYMLHDHEGRLICENCGESYVTCVSCGELFHEDDATYNDDDGCFYCADCMEELSKSNKICSYHAHKGCYEKQKTSKDKSGKPLYFGFELEVENKRNEISNGDMAQKIGELMNGLVVFERDGSLNNGFEIISQPMTLNFIIENKEKIDRMLQTLRDNGFASHDTTTCGLHIHLSRNYFNETQIDKLNLLIENERDNLLKFSRRDRDRQKHWAKFISDETGTNFENQRFDLKYIKDNKKTYDRYFALNLENNSTIEFRLLKGTLKTETFFASLQLLYNMARAAKIKSAKDIETMRFNELVNKGYFKKELQSYCINKNIISESEVE